MKRKAFFIAVLYILIAVFMLQTGPCAFAHLYTQDGILAKSYIDHDGYYDYYIGGENVGWSIDENYHTNGTTLTYSFSNDDPYLTMLYKIYIANGAARWSDVVTITEKTDGTGTGLIDTFSNINDRAVAKFNDYSADGAGHLTSWKISINRAHTQSVATMAHEFGHAIGLNDLYAAENNDKLMYGCVDGATAAYPSIYDQWGAKVITGVHVSHSWGHKYHSITGYGGNRHIKYCTVCYGLTNTITDCTYNSANICTVCGVPYGVQPWQMGNLVK